MFTPASPASATFEKRWSTFQSPPERTKRSAPRPSGPFPARTRLFGKRWANWFLPAGRHAREELRARRDGDRVLRPAAEYVERRRERALRLQDARAHLDRAEERAVGVVRDDERARAELDELPDVRAERFGVPHDGAFGHVEGENAVYRLRLILGPTEKARTQRQGGQERPRGLRFVALHSPFHSLRCDDDDNKRQDAQNVNILPIPLTDCQLQSSKKLGRRGYFAFGVFA
mgnify:CR=1 FL=1